MCIAVISAIALIDQSGSVVSNFDWTTVIIGQNTSRKGTLLQVTDWLAARRFALRSYYCTSSMVQKQ